MILKYINSEKKEIDLTAFETQIYSGNFHNFEWNYDASDRQFGVSLQRFKKNPATYEMVISARKNTAETMTEVFEIFERDVVTQTAGRLYFNDHYLECFIIAQSTAPSDNFFGAEKTCTVFAPYPFWIKENEHSFSIESVAQGNYLDYNLDYSYDYSPPETGAYVWKTGHYAPSEYKLIIYGACTNPTITINGRVFNVYDTVVNENERIEIDSRNETIYKILQNGVKENLFQYRGKESGNIFTPIGGGDLTINWSGGFAFDLILYQERSEPKW